MSGSSVVSQRSDRRNVRENLQEIQLRGVSCTFEHRTGAQVRALRNVTLDVAAGELVCVVGRSGHGKTTLLRLIAGLEGPSSGEIRVGGNLVLGPGSDRGMVFQQDTVFPWMNVRQNVEYGLRAQGVPKSQRRQISQRWLTEVGLQEFADSWPRELSGGMRKRVAVAAVLAAGSRVWLMDEPFGSLDYFTRRGLHELLLGLWAETKKTVVFVTHDIEEALILADRILVVSHGEVVRDAFVDLPRPRDEDVRASSTAVELSKVILHDLGFDREAVLQTLDAGSVSSKGNH